VYYHSLLKLEWLNSDILLIRKSGRNIKEYNEYSLLQQYYIRLIKLLGYAILDYVNCTVVILLYLIES
jgi:hypothetical protein